MQNKLHFFLLLCILDIIKKEVECMNRTFTEQEMVRREKLKNISGRVRAVQWSLLSAPEK